MVPIWVLLALQVFAAVCAVGALVLAMLAAYHASKAARHAREALRLQRRYPLQLMTDSDDQKTTQPERRFK